MKWDGPLEALSPKSSHESQSPPPLQYVSGSMGSNSPSEIDSLPPIQFSPVYQIPTPTTTKKRKSSAIADGTQPSGRQPRGKKISHNVIEKRYRSNLNDKIAKLRDSVPELRSAQPTIKRRPTKAQANNSDSSGDEGGSNGLKFNKATVLTKATEYIQQLERQNQRLLAEVASLRNRLGNADKLRLQVPIASGFEKSSTVSAPVASSTTSGSSIEPCSSRSSISGALSPAGLIKVPEDIRRLREEASPQGHFAPDNVKPNTEDTSGDTPSTPKPPEPIKGMIPMPDDWRRLRESTVHQPHYAPESSGPGILETEEDPFNDVHSGTAWSSRSKAMSRVLIGSLAGLMFMEGFSEKEQNGKDTSGRGLFSLPTELLTESRGFRAQIRQRIIAFAASPQYYHALSVAIISVLFLSIFFALFFHFTPAGSKAIREAHPEEETILTPSPSSPALALISSKTQVDAAGVPYPPAAINRSLTPPLELSGVRFSLRDFFARRAIDFAGFSWLKLNLVDEESMSRPARTEHDYRKRWKNYSSILPKMLDRKDNHL